MCYQYHMVSSILGPLLFYFLLMIYLITYTNVKLASMQMRQLLYALEKLLRKFRYDSNVT